MRFTRNVFNILKKTISFKRTNSSHDGQIGIVGCKNTGKTVYILSLYHLSHNSFGAQFNSNVNVLPFDEDTMEHCRIHLKDLVRGKWPPGNVNENNLAFRIKFEGTNTSKGREVSVKLHDPPGGFYSLAQQEDNVAAQHARAFIRKSNSIFFFIEPDFFYLSGLQKKLEPILNKIKDIENENYEDVGDAIRNNHDLNILLKEKGINEHYINIFIDSFIEEFRANADDNQLKTILNDMKLLCILKKAEITVDFFDDLYAEKIDWKTVSLYSQIHGTDVQAIQKNIITRFKTESLDKFYAAFAQVQNIYKEMKESGNKKSILVIISKADELPVFNNTHDSKKPYIFIPQNCEYLLYSTDKNNVELLKKSVLEYWRDIDDAWDQVINDLFSQYGTLFKNIVDDFQGNFQIFFNSAVGKVERNEHGEKIPPTDETMSPKGVDKPIEWSVKKLINTEIERPKLRRSIFILLLSLLIFFVPISLHHFNDEITKIVEKDNDLKLSDLAPDQIGYLQKEYESVNSKLPFFFFFFSGFDEIQTRAMLLNLTKHWTQIKNITFDYTLASSSQVFKDNKALFIKALNDVQELQIPKKQKAIDHFHLMILTKALSYNLSHEKLVLKDQIRSNSRFNELFIELQRKCNETVNKYENEMRKLENLKNGLSGLSQNTIAVCDNVGNKLEELKKFKEKINDILKNGHKLTFYYDATPPGFSNILLTTIRDNSVHERGVSRGNTFTWIPDGKTSIVLNFSGENGRSERIDARKELYNLESIQLSNGTASPLLEGVPESFREYISDLLN